MCRSMIGLCQYLETNSRKVDIPQAELSGIQKFRERVEARLQESIGIQSRKRESKQHLKQMRMWDRVRVKDKTLSNKLEL